MTDIDQTEIVLAQERFRSSYDHDGKILADAVDTLTAQLAELQRELAATRRAKQENDERFMTERDEARAELAEWRDGAWRDYTIEPSGPWPAVAALCRSNSDCYENRPNDEGTYLTIGQAADWAREHVVEHAQWEADFTPPAPTKRASGLRQRLRKLCDEGWIEFDAGSLGVRRFVRVDEVEAALGAQQVGVRRSRRPNPPGPIELNADDTTPAPTAALPPDPPGGRWRPLGQWPGVVLATLDPAAACDIPGCTKQLGHQPPCTVVVDSTASADRGRAIAENLRQQIDAHAEQMRTAADGDAT